MTKERGPRELALQAMREAKLARADAQRIHKVKPRKPAPPKGPKNPKKHGFTNGLWRLEEKGKR